MESDLGGAEQMSGNEEAILAALLNNDLQRKVFGALHHFALDAEQVPGFKPRDFIRATVSQVMLYALCQEDLEHVIETYDEAWQLLDEAYGLLSVDYEDWITEVEENVWH
jgi:hypothetical protein